MEKTIRPVRQKAGEARMNHFASGAGASANRKNRNRVEIGASILQVAREGARKTRIMYGANLSYGQLDRYLQLLMTRGLLVHDGLEAAYRTTDKGILYLRQYSDYETSKILSDQKRSQLKGFLGA